MQLKKTFFWLFLLSFSEQAILATIFGPNGLREQVNYYRIYKPNKSNKEALAILNQIEDDATSDINCSTPLRNFFARNNLFYSENEIKNNDINFFRARVDDERNLCSSDEQSDSDSDSESVKPSKDLKVDTKDKSEVQKDFSPILSPSDDPAVRSRLIARRKHLMGLFDGYDDEGN